MAVFLAGCCAWLIDGGPGPRNLFHAGSIDGAGAIVLTIAFVADSFDFVHARTLLVTIPDPAQVVAETVRLTKPGGWVVSQEPDMEHALCRPPEPVRNVRPPA
jgi:SAM-dependent methyltransferase